MSETAGRTDRRFVWGLAIAAALLAVLPAVYAWVTAGASGRYLGYQYNTDDQMVYAAWIRQAMDGRFFFDNRFTSDPQPGLTVHIYFYLLGQVARVTGIALATPLARVFFSVLFVWLADRFIGRLDWPRNRHRLALVFVVFGGGVGFLVWHNFGQVDLLRAPASRLVAWAGGGLPVDVWQPEGFVFPSMLTNSLFMVSLCLILYTLGCFLDARESWRPVLRGAIALGALMNVHSYDTLMIGLVLVGLVVVATVRHRLTGVWVGRSAVIALGMILPALWFVHVLRNDPVFQSRAATLTFSPSFRQVVLGYLPLMALGLGGVALAGRSNKASAGAVVAAVLFVALFALAPDPAPNAYFLAWPAFGVALAVAVSAAVLAATDDLTWNLVVTWAFVGPVAIYFPSLFQRKLAMGLGIPWAILAAAGLSLWLDRRETVDAGRPGDGSRNLLTGAAGVLVLASSLLWLVRETSFIRMNVSNTTRHPVYMNADAQRIVDYLNQAPGRKVVLAFPGSKSPARDSSGAEIPDQFESPALPDLAPILSGLTGAYTYAGHWSETPNYAGRAGELNRFFFDEPVGALPPMTDDERRAFERETGAHYVVVPMRESYPGVPFVTPQELGGETVVTGKQFSLVRLP